MDHAVTLSFNFWLATPWATHLCCCYSVSVYCVPPCHCSSYCPCFAIRWRPMACCMFLFSDSCMSNVITAVLENSSIGLPGHRFLSSEWVYIRMKNQSVHSDQI